MPFLQTLLNRQQHQTEILLASFGEEFLQQPLVCLNEIFSHLQISNSQGYQTLVTLAAGLVEKGGFTNVFNTAIVNRLIDLRSVSGAHYQTGTSQDFLGRGGLSLGLIRYYLRGLLNRLLHPLRAINQHRNKRRLLMQEALECHSTLKRLCAY